MARISIPFGLFLVARFSLMQGHFVGHILELYALYSGEIRFLNFSKVPSGSECNFFPL